MKEKVLGTLVALSMVLVMPVWALAGAPPDEQTVPSGTTISLRTNQTIDSKQATNGQTFSAVVEKDVSAENGGVAIPKGSPAELAVAKSNGKTLLALSSVTVDGKQYMVQSGNVQGKNGKRGIGANRRTATHVGGGALLGTVLGAIAGGGKGAAIGAIGGAAAGGLVQEMTKGKSRIPAETVLQFHLNEPLHLGDNQ
ncbi:MAG TPA: hypothetical protein VFZ27_18895 [Terriglobia bacterium]|nr:hypothetical protein [Terriglobia bacterium]